MTLTSSEQHFLSRQPRGHLATVGPDGQPQVKPVGFTYNEALGTVEVAGFNMAHSAKYRNVQVNRRVSFVVDEVTEPGMVGAHFLEIRGLAEAAIGRSRWSLGGGDHPDSSPTARRFQCPP